jgi:hypothetical protein
MMTTDLAGFPSAGLEQQAAAETTLRQLGGRRFIAMTGARDFVRDGWSLRFKLPAGAKDRINLVTVTLDRDADLYRVTFARFRGLDVTVIREESMVYADQLRRVFESATGLATSL